MEDSMRLRRVITDVFMYGGLIVLSIFILLPFVWMVSTSFKPPEDVFRMPPILISRNATLEGYRFVIVDKNALRALFNTALVATVSTAISLFFCTLGGYGFAKFRFPGRGLLFSFLLGTMIIPGAIMIVPTFVLMVKLNWYNTFLPLIVPGAANAFGIFFMRQYISSVSSEIIDAARIDGCCEFGVFWRVVMPICIPGLTTLGLILFMASWNNYLMPSIYLRSPQLHTLPLLQMQMQGPAGYTMYREWMALATISTVPALIIFLLFQRRLVEGITAGALKG
jgi:ABC-type glycerol-3-phosphate transport system permease component